MCIFISSAVKMRHTDITRIKASQRRCGAIRVNFLQVRVVNAALVSRHLLFFRNWHKELDALSEAVGSRLVNGCPGNVCGATVPTVALSDTLTKSAYSARVHRRKPKRADVMMCSKKTHLIFLQGALGSASPACVQTCTAEAGSGQSSRAQRRCCVCVYVELAIGRADSGGENREWRQTDEPVEPRTGPLVS